MTTSPSVPPKNQPSELSAVATSHATIQVAAAIPGPRQADEQHCDQSRRGGAGRGAQRSGDDRRRSDLEEACRDDRAGRDERPLRERRQPADADGECEPGRCKREVEPACEVGKP